MTQQAETYQRPAQRPQPIGLSGSVCNRCWRVFKSPSAFDKHMVADPNQPCRDPQDARMVVVSHTPEGHPVWATGRFTRPV